MKNLVKLSILSFALMTSENIFSSSPKELAEIQDRAAQARTIYSTNDSGELVIKFTLPNDREIKSVTTTVHNERESTTVHFYTDGTSSTSISKDSGRDVRYYSTSESKTVRFSDSGK